MEEDYKISTPYYATAYLDDNNNTHLINITDKKDLDFLQERFTVVSSKYIENY